MNELEKSAFPEIFGYSLISCLGSGGMGSVYLAQDLRLERRVAIKTIDKSSLPDTGLQEAKMQAQINHINVVQIFDVIDSNTFIAVIMEFVEGQTLAQSNARKVVGRNQKLYWMLEIAKGMEAIHRNNIIHSDLSMDNIFVTTENQVKLLDFGIAQRIKINENAIATYANPHFASPEQLKQRPIDLRTDLFSFGVIAYLLMTDMHPFGEPDGRENGIKTGKFIEPKDIAPDISDLLNSLLIQLLSPEVERRPVSFEEVIIRLKRCLAQTSQEHMLIQETVPLAPTTFAANKQQKVITAVGAIAIIVLLGVGYLGMPYFDNKQVDYVIVESLKFDENTSINDTQKMQVKAAIEHAVYQYVIENPDLRLVPESEIERNKYSAQQSALNAGVTNIISSKLNCQPNRCVVNLYHQRAGETQTTAKDWQVVAQTSWPTQIQDSQGIALSTLDQLTQLFPKSEGLRNKIVLVGQDYDNYLKIFNEVKLQGKRQLASWQSLRRVIEDNPKALSAYWLLRELSIDLYYESNDEQYLTGFIERLNRAPTEYQLSEIGLTDRFMVSLAANDLAQAQTTMNKMLEIGIDNTFKFELNARLLFALGDYKKAASNYQMAINNRHSSVLLHNLGLALFYAGDIAGTEQALKRALEINQSFYLSNQLLASVYLLSEDLDKAIRTYQRLIELEPSSQNLNDLSIAYMLKGEFIMAMGYAKRAVEMSPLNPVQILNLGDLTFFSGNQAQAEKLYADVLEIEFEQNNTDALLVKAQALVHLGQHQDAVAIINQAEREAADNIEVLYTAALVYTQVNELVSASVHVKEALAQGIGALWFNIPWFKPLCDKPWFADQINGLRAPSVCKNYVN